MVSHDDVIKWKHFPRYWPFVQAINRSSANSPHKGQWRGALMFSLICALNKRLSKHREAGDLRRHRAHYDVIVMVRNVFHVVYIHRGSLQYGYEDDCSCGHLWWQYIHTASVWMRTWEARLYNCMFTIFNLHCIHRRNKKYWFNSHTVTTNKILPFIIFY